MITIYAKDGTAKCQARKLTLSEEFMGVAKMVVDIASPEPIDFAIDDYIDYSYNSRRYLLKDLAKVKKQARRNTYGEAFVYTCTFYEQTWELENCPFLDLVPAQQTAVYSSLPDVTVYAKPQNIVERVQANLDSFYGENEWEVLIPNYITDPTVLKLLDTYKDISLSQATCKGALDEIYKQWGLSWIFVTAYGRKQIYVAFAGDISNLFKYGKGQGLRAITVEQKDTASLATRIYPYGSTENLPARWYNEHPLDSDPKYIDEFQYIPHLMLPPSLWHGGTPDGNYVEDADAIAKYGLRPKTIYFEGGEYEKIMPSISGLTAKDIRDAKTEIGDTENVPSTTLYPDATRMDRTLTGDSTMDNGVKPSDSGSSDDTETFSFDAAAKEITIVNSENGGPVTSFSGDEVTYVDKMFFPLDTVSLSKIAQYIISFNSGSVSLSLSSTTTALLDRFSITPLICAYAPNISTEVEILAEGTPLAMPSGGEAWSPSESLAHLFADAEAILKVYQSQMDALPFSAQLYLGFIIDYKFATATEATYEIPVTINLSAGGGESVRGVTQIANRFTVKIKQIGFDIMSCKQSANENRQLNMKSGLCAGYSFNILKTQYNASDDSWTLTCYRTTDTDLKIAFPNTDRHIMPEDEFVLTGIEMPDIYVYAAMEKLYEQALLTLAELSKPKMVYAPEIDNQKMAASPQVLHAGMLLQTEDTDLDIPALLPVDSLQITEDGEKLRQYSVTLRNEKADSLLRQIVTIAHNEQGVSERQVSTAINQALGNYTSNQENEQGGGASGSSSISFQPQGTGNAITEIVESTPGLYIAKKEKTFVDLISEQTVTGKKYLSSLLISALLAIPTVTPSPDSADANRSFLWCDTAGNYAETPSGGGGGGGETLTVTKNGQSWLSYNGSQAVTLNLVIPTKVSDLDNDSGFLTAATLPIASANTLGGIKVGSGLTIDSNGVLTPYVVEDSMLILANDGTLGVNVEQLLQVVGFVVSGSIDALNLGTASQKNYTTSVTQNGADLPTSGAVYSAIAAAVTSALHYRGMSSTALTDGGTETAIIGGVALTPQSGDVVIYNGFEFLWENNVWNKLGDDTSYALKTIQINGDGTYITGGGDLTATRTLTLSAAVIASLGKADTALQSSSLDGYVNEIETGTGNYISGVSKSGKKLTFTYGTLPTTIAWGSVTGKPTTLSGYGITDAYTKTEADTEYAKYLPLTAGSGKPLTGNLYFDASSANKSIWATLSSGSIEALRIGTNGNVYLTPNAIGQSSSLYLYGSAISVIFGTSASNKQLNFVAGMIRPSVDNDIYLGYSNYRFKALYATTVNATDINASGLATLPSIHAATSLSIPKVAPDTTAAWYDSSHAYLWSDSEGNYAESASGGGGGGGETLTITKNGSAWLSYNGSTAVSLNLVVPTALSDLTADSTHRLVTDTQIAAWNDKATQSWVDQFVEEALEDYLPLTAGSGKMISGPLYFDVTSANKSIYAGLSSGSFEAIRFTTAGHTMFGVGNDTNSRNLYFYGSIINFGFGKNVIFNSAACRPTTNGDVSLGATNYRWSALYATTLYGNLALSYLTGADDLKAIEALTETSGFLKKTAANTWALTNEVEATSLKTSTESSPMFTFRQTPSVAVGDSLTLTKIKGKTLVWNQLIWVPTTASWTDRSIVVTNNGDGSYTLNGTADSTGYLGGFRWNGFRVYADRKYYISLLCTGGSISDVTKLSFSPTNMGSGLWVEANSSGIRTTTRAGDPYMAFYVSSGVVLTNYKVWPIMIDLTTEFGSGNEPADVATFEALYGLRYYSYNTGSLLSLTASALQTTGKNIWDEEWEVGLYDTTTGGKTNGSNCIRSKAYIPIFPGIQYYIKYGSQYSQPRLFYYDADKNYISTDAGYAIPFTTPANARYMNFHANVSGGIYSNDICINKSDTTFNGTYEPYKSNVARLDITTLKVKSPNIWDEEWEVGIYSSTDGQPDNSYTNNIRSKNAIPVLPSTTYYIYTGVGQVKVLYYTSADGFISVTSTAAAYAFTTPSNAAFIRFNTNNAYGNTYNNNISLNLSNPGHNGKYYPHGEFAPYADGMKDAGTAYDELRSKSTTRRIIKIELDGSEDETWSLGSAERFGCTNYKTIIKAPSASSDLPTNIRANREVKAQNQQANFDNCLAIVTNGTINYRNTTLADVTALRAYLANNPILIVIELRYPEDFELVTPLDLMLPSDALGTQRLLPENGATPTTAPMVAEITYGANIGDAVGNIDTRLDNFGFDDLASHPTTLSGYGITDAVPSSRKVNNKALSSDITLTLDDLADGSTRKLADYLPLSGGTMTGNITFSSSSDKSIYANNGTLNQRVLLMSSSGNLSIGYDLPTNSKNLYLDGYNIYLRYGTTRENSILLNGSNGTIAGLKNMVSATTETYNLGNTGNRWLGVYANTVNAATGFTTAGTLSVTGVSTFTGNLVPNTTNATDIGSSSKKFKNLYLAGTATVNGISSSGNILPSSTGLSLGSSSNKWAALWTDDLGVNGAVLTSLIPDDGVFNLGASGAEWNSVFANTVYTGDFVVSGTVLGDLIPDDNYDLGSSSTRWGSLFALQADISNALAIPKIAPSNPDANKAYLWIDTNGNYAELPNS